MEGLKSQDIWLFSVKSCRFKQITHCSLLFQYDDFQAQQVAYQASNNGKRSRTIGSKLAYYQQVINAYDNFWNTCPGVGNSEPLIDDNTYTDSDYFDDKDEFETDLSAYVRTSPE